MSSPNRTDPSLPPYPGRAFVYAQWPSRRLGGPQWHKAIVHNTPQAVRLPGHQLDWLIRKCDGYDGYPVEDSYRTSRPPQGGPHCPSCFPL